MRPLSISAVTAVSAVGRGAGATFEALRARRSGLRAEGFLGIERGAIGRVEGVEGWALPVGMERFACRNNRLADMALRCDGFDEAVAAARTRYGAGRIGVVLGTSTSGILAGEDAYRARDGHLPAAFDHAHTQDLYSVARYVRAVLGLEGPASVVSTACASTTRSFTNARHLIDAGICDAVVVGGADSLCRMTLEGFAALDLIAPEVCRPGDAGRRGISIGEAAGFALLERMGARESGSGVQGVLLGDGASSDGHHMSAPHPEGVGAVLAMRAALRRAGLKAGEIDYVNLHGTGTVANDAMEDRAVHEVFGPGVVCSSTKGWSGHTLGASGILECLIGLLCIEHGFVPGALGVEVPDPAFGVPVLRENRLGAVRRVMSNAFGFGGANGCLIFGGRA